MTLVSCNLVHVTLKVVWAEIPAVCFCGKYHTARLPEPHWGRPDQATGYLLTPPLEKTNSLTMKHLSFPPPLHTSPLFCLCFFICSLTTSLPTFIPLFPLNVSCFSTSALSHKAVSPLMFSCIVLHPACTSQVTGHVRETAQYRPFVYDIILFSGVHIRFAIPFMSSLYILLLFFLQGCH